MSNEMMLYWFTRLDNIIILIGVLLLVFICVFAFLLWVAFEEGAIWDDNDSRVTNKPCVFILALNFLFIIFLTLAAIFTPSTKEMAFIFLGGKIANYAENNDELKKIPDNTIKLLNSKMEEYLKDKAETK